MDDSEAALARLAAMTPAEQERFAAAVEDAWQANGAAYRAAKGRRRVAIDGYARLEATIGARCRRERRWPTEAEQEALDAAQAAVDAARDEHTQAGERFKAGVTADQLGDWA